MSRAVSVHSWSTCVSNPTWCTPGQRADILSPPDQVWRCCSQSQSSKSPAIHLQFMLHLYPRDFTSTAFLTLHICGATLTQDVWQLEGCPFDPLPWACRSVPEQDTQRPIAPDERIGTLDGSLFPSVGLCGWMGGWVNEASIVKRYINAVDSPFTFKSPV